MMCRYIVSTSAVCVSHTLYMLEQAAFSSKGLGGFLRAGFALSACLRCSCVYVNSPCGRLVFCSFSASSHLRQSSAAWLTARAERNRRFGESLAKHANTSTPRSCSCSGSSVRAYCCPSAVVGSCEPSVCRPRWHGSEMQRHRYEVFSDLLGRC